ncbi:MAG: signal peptidase II, partial [Microgenomates group bacterium]
GFSGSDFVRQVRERKREIILGLLFVLDRLTKFLAVRQGLAFFNRGVVLGIPLSGFSPFVLICVLILFRQSLSFSFGFWLILAGGVSNLLDRVFYGAVVDFVAFPFIPLFNNLADFFITLGILLVFVDLLWSKKLR